MRDGNAWAEYIMESLALYADPENTDARYLCADALEQLGYQAESGPWRSAYLCAAQELRNGTNTDDATRSNGNGDVFLHMTPDMILDYLGIIVDTTKISAITLSGKTTVSVHAGETDISAESEENQQILFDDAVEDAMIIDKDEILPVVSLEEGQPYAVYDEEGRILLYTFHKYPDSYPDGADIKLEWGNVWTFTGGELEDWYQKNKENVIDWQTRIKELIGLRPDNESNHFTAMWVKPEDVFRPAYVSDIGTIEMTDAFSEDVDEDYKECFDSNIISSYFDGEYPWTRLGYTYDW